MPGVSLASALNVRSMRLRRASWDTTSLMTVVVAELARRRDVGRVVISSITFCAEVFRRCFVPSGFPRRHAPPCRERHQL